MTYPSKSSISLPHKLPVSFLYLCLNCILRFLPFVDLLLLRPKSLRKAIQIARHNNNKSMYNPQQNININISYNLGQNKQKALPAKRITKIQKPAFSSGPCDIEIKLKGKVAEELKKST